MAVEALRRRFNVDEYYEMARAGILGPEDRVELIEGEIVAMTPIGPRHSADVDRCTNILAPRLQGRAIVRIQGPVRLDDYSEPEPDVAILKPRADFYSHAHPGPEDVLLLIEVSETSADFDQRVRTPLYARFGILELWRVDVGRSVIVVHRDPGPEGYETILTVRRGEKLSPALLPDLEIEADEILG